MIMTILTTQMQYCCVALASNKNIVIATIIKNINANKPNGKTITINFAICHIPVNADAEYIISMNSESDKVDVKYEGTMDDLSVRKEICDVMEGIEFAFSMRAHKYHLRFAKE